jgi:hypothetical protein
MFGRKFNGFVDFMEMEIAQKDEIKTQQRKYWEVFKNAVLPRIQEQNQQHKKEQNS